MPADHPERAVLRILRVGTAQPTPVGAALRVSARLALTCAHVVNAALGRDPDCADRPDRPVPYACAPVRAAGPEQAPPTAAGPPTAGVIGWHPYCRQPRPGALTDIAVLELAAPSDPGDCLPLPRPAPPVPWGGAGRALGFPAGCDWGQWCRAALAGALHDGRIQVDDLPGPRIEGGYSGGPFLDPDQAMVIGMIAARHRASPVAYLIPAADLATALDQAAGDTLTLALDNPLVVAPAAPRLAFPILASNHVTAVSAQLRRLLLDPRLRPPWVRDGRELDAALALEPDLIYCLATLDPAGRLLLGKHDDRPDEPLDLDRLVRGLEPAARAGRKPLIWLHLVGDPRRAPDAATLTRLGAVAHLLVLQQSAPDDVERAQQDSLDALDQLADRGQDPALVLAELARRLDPHARQDPPPLRVWPAAPRLRIRPPNDPAALEKAQIRAALIRLLLGHAEEKGWLRTQLDQVDLDRRNAPAQDGGGAVLLYALGGDEYSGVHDLPEQLRGYLERFDPRARVEPRPIPCLLRGGTAGPNDFGQLFRQDLGVAAGRRLERALRDCLRPEPLAGETVTLVLSWLLEVPSALTRDEFTLAITAWGQAMARALEEREVPSNYRILCGAYIRWPEDWPARARLSAPDLQTRLNGLVRDTVGGPHQYPIRMKRPLGLLDEGDLAEFYDPERGLGRKLRIPDLTADLARRLPIQSADRPGNPQQRTIERLAAWLLDPERTGGHFEKTVDLIYTEYKCDYAGFRTTLPAG